jgi:trimeric autotransporter adhesin
MKKIFILTVICTLFFGHVVFSQHVGIGTVVPAFKLDVKGGSINTDSLYRIGGNPVLSVKGTANTFAGINSGFSITTGNSNTGAGMNALLSNTEGSLNTATGRDALYYNTVGYNNTANGASALRYNIDGVYNVAIGFQSLFSNTSGNFNTANGTSALYSNTSGGLNTASGQSALYRNTTGSQNTTGHYNTANGVTALINNTTGEYNTATGSAALYNNSIGSSNVANGYSALVQNISGTGNTGIGFQALNLPNASSFNTAIGYQAGYGVNYGWNNTLIGASINATVTGIFNSIALGNSVTVTASNQARIGNSSTNSIGGFANWTNISDGRYKKNIHEDVKGIDFIMKLRPVTYQLDISNLSKQLNEQQRDSWNDDMKKGMTEKEKMIQSGFIAQEVEAVAKELGYDFSGVDKPKNATDLYGLRYAEFVVPLVKAMQEQQLQLNEMKKEMDLLKSRTKYCCN